MEVPTDEEWRAYLDEQLPAEQSAQLEALLRESAACRSKVAALLAARDPVDGSLGAIWRTQRLSCPTREELGRYVLRALGHDAARYVEFHLTTVGCRYCQADLGDLQEHLVARPAPPQTQRIFESSVGYLRRPRD